MDTLHTVLRTINDTKAETRPARSADHLTVFREFLQHLDRAHKRNTAKARTTTKPPAKTRRGRKG